MCRLGRWHEGVNFLTPLTRPDEAPAPKAWTVQAAVLADRVQPFFRDIQIAGKRADDAERVRLSDPLEWPAYPAKDAFDAQIGDRDDVAGAGATSRTRSCRRTVHRYLLTHHPLPSVRMTKCRVRIGCFLRRSGSQARSSPPTGRKRCREVLSDLWTAEDERNLRQNPRIRAATGSMGRSASKEWTSYRRTLGPPNRDIR